MGTANLGDYDDGGVANGICSLERKIERQVPRKRNNLVVQVESSESGLVTSKLKHLKT
jgi:hypothetical protein